MVKHGSSQLRYVLINCCLPLIRFDVTFATYYARKRSENKPHRVAITHVAKKLVRVIYALESQDIDFDPKKLRWAHVHKLTPSIWNTLFSDGLLRLPFFINHKIPKKHLTVYSLSPPPSVISHIPVLLPLWYAKHIGIKAVFFYLLLFFYSYFTIIL